MKDSELLRLTRGFRSGILEGRSSDMMCFAVAWPLQAFLSAVAGIESTLMSSDFGYVDHVWLKLADGRCLDPTADQLNKRRNGQKFPAVYIGPVPYAHRRHCKVWADHKLEPPRQLPAKQPRKKRAATN